jgi:hypothetical protein
MALPLSELCRTRARLVARFSRDITYYHCAFAGLLDASIPVEQATEDTMPLYRMAVESRGNLQAHEREHGCADLLAYGENVGRGSNDGSRHAGLETISVSTQKGWVEADAFGKTL